MCKQIRQLATLSVMWCIEYTMIFVYLPMRLINQIIHTHVDQTLLGPFTSDCICCANNLQPYIISFNSNCL